MAKDENNETLSMLIDVIGTLDEQLTRDALENASIRGVIIRAKTLIKGELLKDKTPVTMKLLCNRNLRMDAGQIAFTKGKVYETRQIKLWQHTMVIDNQNDDHIIGSQWLKHFSIINDKQFV